MSFSLILKTPNEIVATSKKGNLNMFGARQWGVFHVRGMGFIFQLFSLFSHDQSHRIHVWYIYMLTFGVY